VYIRRTLYIYIEEVRVTLIVLRIRVRGVNGFDRKRFVSKKKR
jgi:hypothetical protein